MFESLKEERDLINSQVILNSTNYFNLNISNFQLQMNML